MWVRAEGEGTEEGKAPWAGSDLGLIWGKKKKKLGDLGVEDNGICSKSRLFHGYIHHGLSTSGEARKEKAKHLLRPAKGLLRVWWPFREVFKSKKNDGMAGIIPSGRNVTLGRLKRNEGTSHRTKK